MSARQSHAPEGNGKATGRKSLLLEFVDKTVSVITNDGRNVVGQMRGFDQVCNIILDKCVERVFSTDIGMQTVSLGLHVIRGDNIAIVGEVDKERDEKIPWDQTQVRGNIQHSKICH